MHRAFIGLGSNLGDARENMRFAVNMITRSRECRIVSVSSLYETLPVGLEDQPVFLNAVVEISTSLSPRDLLHFCSEIEKKLGRERTIRWGPRVIDVDILLYDDIHVSEPDLEIPHPRMLERAFVMVPLREIAQDMRLSSGETIDQIAERTGSEGVTLVEGKGWIE